MKLKMNVLNGIYIKCIKLTSDIAISFYDGSKIQAWDNSHDNTDFTIDLTNYKNLRKFTKAYKEYKKQLYLIVDGEF